MLIKIYRILRKTFDGTGISRVYPLNKLHAWFLNQYKAEKIVVNNYTLFLDENDTLRLTVKGDYDKFQMTIIDKIVHSGDIVFDIGANIGYYTLYLSQKVGSKGIVYAFEPDANIFKLLKRSIAENNYTNIKAYEKAVTEKNTRLKLSINKVNRGDNRIYTGNDNQDWEQIEIEGVQLDTFLDCDNVSFMKIDIQGSEFGAFKGMKRIIDSSKNLTILTEFWPQGISNFGDNPLTMLQFFIEKGYTIYEVDQKRSKLLTLTPDELLIKYPIDIDVHTDLLISNNPRLREQLGF